MALPQTVDPTTLNLSGKPAMATAPTTTTSSGASNIVNPTIAQEKSNVSPLLGALFGAGLGYKYSMANQGAGGAGGAGAGQSGAGGTGNLLNSLIKAVTGGGTPTGNIGSVNNVIIPSGMSGTEAQNWLNQNYGTTNGQPNYVVSGTNLSTGEAIGLPNTNIGGTNLGTNTGNYGTTGDGSSSTGTGTLTNIGSGYFMDDNSNVYDSNGNLIYQNPSNVTGTQTEPSGGGYDPNAGTTTDTSGGYFQDATGNIYDYNGDLVMAYNNGYYYEPDTGNFYDANTWDVVSDSFDPYTDYFNIPIFDSSSTTLPSGVDMSGYGTDWTTTWVKDGGSISKNGLPTPLFKRGGGVRGYADGGTSFTDQVVANQMPQSVATTSATPSTTSTSTSSTGNILDSILGFAQSNPMLTGAGLGALLTQLINSSSASPVNKGVDMSALATLKPRTTPTGAARYVPYSEYGTPTTPFDYSTLYSNLGVSPFGGGAVSPSTPTSAAPTPTMPVTAPATTPTTGGLPAITAPTSPTATTPTTTTPTYFTDADGNIYDADGNLVYDVTSGAGSVAGSEGTVSTTPSVSSGLAVSSLPTTTIADASYSYGTPVSPAEILGSKKGGLAVKKMADGGSAHQYVNPFTGENVSNEDVFNIIKQYIPLMEDADINKLIATDPYLAQAYFNNYYQLGEYNPSNSQQGSTSTAIDPFSDPASFVYKDPTTGDFAYPEYATDAIKNLADFTTSSTGTDFPPVMYNQGMPEQRQDLMPTQNQSAMPTQGNLMPTQGALMPQQGSAMPQQTPFSPSPTFRYSGANNPLLTGLRQGMPSQQPFMLMSNGTFAPREEISTSRQYGYAMGGQPMTDNLNVPVSNRPFQNVPAIQGRGDYRQGAYVEGAGDGQSDDIPAMLADGEYVIDAETVAQLGNGSNKAGAKMLDEFRKNIRAHKRSAPHDKIPPKSKSPLAYLKGAK